MVWVGEGVYLVVFLLLVWIDEHEAVVGKVCLELRRQFGKGWLVGDAALARRDNHQQMVGAEFVAKGRELIPGVEQFVVITGQYG